MAARPNSPTAASADWDFVADVADALTIPVFGSGDCVEPEQIVERLRQGVSGVYVGRGVLRNPWILAQAQDLLEGRPARQVSLDERGQFLLDYIEMLQDERVHEPEGFRHVAPGAGDGSVSRRRSPRGTIGGSSTSFARCAAGIPRAWKAARGSARRSTAPRRSRTARDHRRLLPPGTRAERVNPPATE